MAGKSRTAKDLMAGATLVRASVVGYPVGPYNKEGGYRPIRVTEIIPEAECEDEGFQYKSLNGRHKGSTVICHAPNNYFLVPSQSAALLDMDFGPGSDNPNRELELTGELLIYNDDGVYSELKVEQVRVVKRKSGLARLVISKLKGK